MCKMIPLEQWICDSCGGLVDIKSGWLEWLEASNGRHHSFHIVHRREQCFHHTNHSDRKDMHINAFLGADGLQYFLSMLDEGPIISPIFNSVTPDLRSFIDIIRRLHIPYYEEARIYFDAAEADGYFHGYSEVVVYLPETCKHVIETYERI